MKRSLLIGVALAAAQPALANDLFKGIFKQAVNNVAQQAVNTVQSSAEAAVSAALSPSQARPQAPAVAPAAAPTPVAAPVARVATTGGPSSRVSMDYGGEFSAGPLVDYWSRADASNRGSTPALDAPGNVSTRSVFGGNLKEAGVPEMRRKLELILARMLAHPALREIRGSSLRSGGGFGHDRGGPMGPAVAGSVSLNAYPINPDDPKTMRFPDGSMHTPGEGDVIRVTVNDPDVLDRRMPIGQFDGLMLVQSGSGYLMVVPNTDRPVFLAEGSGRQTAYTLNPDLVDPSRPRTDIQFMTVYVGAARPTWDAIYQNKVEPTAGVGRLLGVMFNTDWRAVLKEANQVR